jgi:hypothetical protein
MMTRFLLFHQTQDTTAVDREDASQMWRVEDDHVIQTLSAD